MLLLWSGGEMLPYVCCGFVRHIFEWISFAIAIGPDIAAMTSSRIQFISIYLATRRIAVHRKIVYVEDKRTEWV